MWIYLVFGVVGMLAVIFIWGVLHLRQSQRTALAAIQGVTIAEIDDLRQECEAVFSRCFSETLELDDLESSAQLLSDRLDNPESLKKAFAKPDFYWYFVLPVGAYLGELLRVHAAGEWSTSEDGGPEMKVPAGSDFATTFPFDKVIKHVAVGDPGDVFAYLMSALHLEDALTGLAPSPDPQDAAL